MRTLQQTTDGGYLLGGYSASNISGDKNEHCFGGPDYWIVKLSPEIVPVVEAAQRNLEVYPNPTADKVFIRTEKAVNLNLYNAFVQMLFTQTVQDMDEIDLSALPEGFYFLIETETAYKILKNE